jgi:hypothetical protein
VPVNLGMRPVVPLRDELEAAGWDWLWRMYDPFCVAACGGDFVIMTTKFNGDDDQFNTQQPGVFMSMGSNAQAQLGDASYKNQWVPQLLNNDALEITSVSRGRV